MITTMERTRSREQVATAMRQFAAEDVSGRAMHELARNPATYGAGEPLKPIRPTRAHHVKVEAPPRTWLKVIDEVCVRHQVHRRDLLAGWKADKVVACRQELWAVLRATTKASLATIGRRTGGFHHTTVMHGIRMHAARLPSPESRTVK